MPFLIITCGATGSGKTNLAKKTIRLINKTEKKKIQKNNTWFILVDDLIENNFDYKRRIDLILKKYLLKKTEKIPKNIFDKFKTAYFTTRKTSCKTIDSSNCDELNDLFLEEAMNTGKNIIFESTCNYFPLWLINKIPKSYKIIMSYSIVNFVNLLGRNKNRFFDQIKKYSTDKINNPAPRLPDLNQKMLKDIKDNLYNNVYKCMIDHNKNCGNKKFDLIIYDNNPKNSKLIYHIKYNAKKNQV